MNDFSFFFIGFSFIGFSLLFFVPLFFLIPPLTKGGKEEFKRVPRDIIICIKKKSSSRPRLSKAGGFFVASTLFLTGVPFAQGEPALETSRFEKALPGYIFSFPRDHGSHPAYLIEWWYFTGNLQSKNGYAYGYELTFFRRGIENKFTEANPSRWTVHDIYLAHFAVSDIANKQFYYEEKISREAMGKAGAQEDKMAVWIDRWSATQAGETMRLIAGAEDFHIDLLLSPAKPLAIHGAEGVSRKGDAPGEASHYYSFTRLQTQGTVRVKGKDASVSGFSWMDHEFGSSLLGKDQVGWDWFSIQLDDGSDYMFYRIREKDGSRASTSRGTVIALDGTARHLSSDDFSLNPASYWTSPKSGASYPLSWEISVPSERLSLTWKPALNDQELITAQSTRVIYWEGAGHYSGLKNGHPVEGAGYVELTGYAKALGE